MSILLKVIKFRIYYEKNCITNNISLSNRLLLIRYKRYKIKETRALEQSKLKPLRARERKTGLPRLRLAIVNVNQLVTFLRS